MLPFKVANDFVNPDQCKIMDNHNFVRLIHEVTTRFSTVPVYIRCAEGVTDGLAYWLPTVVEQILKRNRYLKKNLLLHTYFFAGCE
jgi:hypothetical protein